MAVSKPLSPSKGRKTGEVLDVALEVSAVVLSTLRGVSSLSPIGGIREAAGIALVIIEIVQHARGNKDGFKALAVDSAELVYAIIHAQKDTTRPEDLPLSLVKNLEQLVATLSSIQRFAEKGASRNFFKAMIRANVDAGQIQMYREKLQQSMRVFGLQTDIDLRDTVHRLEKQQGELMKVLQNERGATGTVSTEYVALRAVGGGFGALVNAVHGNVQIEAISGDKISNNISNTINNTNSNNVITNSTYSVGNSTTTYTNTYYR